MLSSLDRGAYQAYMPDSDWQRYRVCAERLNEGDSIDCTDEHRHRSDDIKEMEAILHKRPQSLVGRMLEATCCCRCQ